MPSSKSTSIVWTIVAVLILAGAILAIAFTRGNTGGVPSAEEIARASSTVEDFGEQLRQVSLLASPADLGQAMDANYADYVTPELLAVWKTDLSQALGRRTSSPWPESIEIVSAEGHEDGTITVSGNVREVATAEGGGRDVVSVYPVTFKLQKNGTRWLISSAVKGPETTMPQTVTMTGTYLCLPHKNPGEVQTLECAFGLQAADGSYYALDMSAYTGLAEDVGIGTGTAVRVTGTLMPIEQISSDQWQNYPIKGIIKVSSFEAA